MSHRDFSADRRARRGESVTFTLDGETFEAVPDAPAGVVLDMSVADMGPAQVRAALGFLDEVLLPESAERFAARMKCAENPITVAEIGELLSWLLEVYAGRPPVPPSTSPSSQLSNGPISTAASPPQVSTP